MCVCVYIGLTARWTERRTKRSAARKAIVELLKLLLFYSTEVKTLKREKLVVSFFC